MESTLLAECISLFSKITPQGWKNIQRAIGLGAAVYVARAIWISSKSRIAKADVKGWRNSSVFNAKICDKYPELSCSCPLYDLPGVLRRRIFSLLPFEDVENLRLVCKLFLQDIDFFLGVRALSLNYQTDRFNWYKTVAIRICSVVNLIPRRVNFLMRPSVLKYLELSESCVIRPNDFVHILSKCTNIRNLSVYVLEDICSIYDNNEKIFKTIEKYQKQNGSNLESISVAYVQHRNACKWVTSFKKSNERTSKFNLAENMRKENDLAEKNDDILVFPSKTECVRLNFGHFRGFHSIDYAKNRLFWKEFLSSQMSLKILECNYRPGCWDVYVDMIRKNSLTLETLCLTNVGCWDHWSEREHKECPYNWNSFSKCPKLVQLSITGEGGSKLGPKNFIPLQRCTMHLRVLHCDFGVSFWRLYTSIISMNAQTLEDIRLRRLVNTDAVNRRESHFDWRTFANCRALKHLEIAGLYTCFLDTINFNMLPTVTLRSLKLEWVVISVDDVRQMLQFMPHLITDFKFLESCQINGIWTGESVEQLIERLNKVPLWHTCLNGFQRVATSLPLPEIAGIAWVCFSNDS